MPYIIRKRGDEWCVYTEGADGEPKGDPHGCHPSEEAARKQQAALYVHAPDGKSMSGAEWKMGSRPAEKEGAPKSPPKGYPSDRSAYGDPTNYRYPLDTEDHVRAALSYWGRARNRAGYTSSEQAYITGRIEAAARRFGIELEGDEDEEKSMGGMLTFAGGEVKALGGNRIGGYLIRFGTPEESDLSAFRDFFTKSTDFGTDEWPVSRPVLFNHGLHPEVGRRRLGVGTLKLEDEGVFIEAVLNEHDEWARRVLALLQKKSAVTGGPPLYWSSGSANHLVAREAVKSGTDTIAHRVTEWPVVEASLTPTPAEPRNVATALKAEPFPGWPGEDEGDCAECRRRSLAGRTEEWLSRGADLLAGYEQVAAAEMKVGRALSAARVGKLEQMIRILQELLAGAGAREAAPGTPAADTETEDAPGMGAPASPMLAGADEEASRSAIGDLYARLVRSEESGLAAVGGLSL